MLIQGAGTGAVPPTGAPWSVGTAAPGVLPSGPALQQPPSIDLRVARWPVRDQGQRGTCVAFGAAACLEHVRSGGKAPVPDLSEQFLYWAAKMHGGDPKPNDDGTALLYARNALDQIGICDEQLWSYNGTPGPTVTQASHNDPSVSAQTNAQLNRVRARGYQQMGLSAGTVLASLQQGRPVAISLPVFKDAFFRNDPSSPTNWTMASGWAYGRVLNPPPQSVAVGGHAVCIVGWEPDPSEPQGGYFIIRNSWGTNWGAQAPSTGNSYSPAPGYGEISASYVENYTWEILEL